MMRLLESVPGPKVCQRVKIVPAARFVRPEVDTAFQNGAQGCVDLALCSSDGGWRDPRFSQRSRLASLSWNQACEI